MKYKCVQFYSVNCLFLGGGYWLFSLPDSSPVEGVEEAKLYQTWFELVLEKNRLARYESELMIL